jgi:hypothetical protein
MGTAASLPARYRNCMSARTAAAVGLGWLGDVAGILLVGVAVPVAVLVVGMPIVLVVRLLIEVAGRL